MPRASKPLPSEVHRILRRQHDVISREQAIASGLSIERIEGLLRYRLWYRLAPGVYCASGLSASPTQAIRAVSLWAGRGAVIVGPAALFWQRRRLHEPALIDVASTKHLRSPQLQRLSRPVAVVPHRRTLGENDSVKWDGILVARTEIVVNDLLPAEGPALLDDAVRQSWITVSMVQEANESSPRRRGDVLRTAILDAASTGAISDGERLLHRHLKAAGVTGWRANRSTWINGSRRVGDAIFDKIGLVLEVDGFAFHTDHDRFQDDRARQNDFVGSGFAVLRFTWWQLKNEPDEVIRQVKKTIDVLERRAASS
jgi:very-short-patch-repair endonuclease